MQLSRTNICLKECQSATSSMWMKSHGCMNPTEGAARAADSNRPRIDGAAYVATMK